MPIITDPMFGTALKLSERWCQKIYLMPETAMGWHAVDIYLKNGMVKRGVWVGSGAYILNPSFDEDDIVDIKRPA